MFLRRKKTKTDLLKEQVQELTGKAVEMSGRAATTLAPKVESAVEAAGAAYGTATAKVRDEYAPLVLDEYIPRAVEAATPHVDKAKAAAAPAVAAALAKAATVLPGTPDPEPEPRGGRLKKLLVLLGLGGVAFAVVRRLQGSSEPPAPSRPTPVPDPAPAPNPAAPPTPQPFADAADTGNSGDTGTLDKPVEAETTKPLIDTGDAHPAGDQDGHATGR